MISLDFNRQNLPFSFEDQEYYDFIYKTLKFESEVNLIGMIMRDPWHINVREKHATFDNELRRMHIRDTVVMTILWVHYGWTYNINPKAKKRPLPRVYEDEMEATWDVHI